MRKIACLLIVLLTLSGAASCGDVPSAAALMREFCTEYGIDAAVYSPEVSEGESGYVYDGFLETLYGDISGGVSDFAIILRSDGMETRECAVFIAYSESDALLIADACYERLELIRTVTLGDAPYLDDAFVQRRGDTVVMCALSDNTLAHVLWKSIL